MNSSDLAVTVLPVTTHHSCRVCDTELELLWDLGLFSVPGFPLPGEPPPARAPITLTLCRGCGLVQLRDTVAPDRLFREYWYRSGTNEAMVAALQNVVEQARRRCPVNDLDEVLDIGANDGTLLEQYKVPCPIRTAFDPAEGIRDELRRHCEVLIPEFFPDSSALPRAAAFKIITAVAMAYDLEDPLAFFGEVARLLHPDGLFVLQCGYLGDLHTKNAFDSICHEHLEYYSLTALVGILARVGLVVEEVSFNRVNGGSIRCYVRHSDYLKVAAPHVSVMRALNQESLDGLHEPERYQWLKQRVDRIRTQVWDHVLEATRFGGFIDLYGASTKGLTLVQYFGISSVTPHVRCAVDRNPLKYGRTYGDTKIPIVSEEVWRDGEPPIFSLVLPWHFREGILDRERETKRLFLFPLPMPEMTRAGD